MAEEQQQQQERTEQATPKRKRDARRKGQTARSKDLNMAIVMIAGALLLFAGGSHLGETTAALVHDSLSLQPAQVRDPAAMLIGLVDGAKIGLIAIAPLLIFLPLAAILGGVVMGGWVFSMSALTPKLSNVNPLTGLKRVFGTKGLVEMLKALAKAGLVGGCGFAVLAGAWPDLLMLGAAAVPVSLAGVWQMVALIFFVCSMSLIAIALIDVPFQLWSHNRQLRMTRKEVQDEMKETEGRPEVRGRIRAMQQEIANRKMLADVADADVIATNPTHFAVALKYDDSRMSAPLVVAKGVDYMAARIREIAAENSVALFESPLLARALYHNTRVGQEIPTGLYVAVAQVLTYVFTLRGIGAAKTLDEPDIKLPEEFDSEGKLITKRKRRR